MSHFWGSLHSPWAKRMPPLRGLERPELLIPVLTLKGARAGGFWIEGFANVETPRKGGVLPESAAAEPQEWLGKLANLDSVEYYTALQPIGHRK